MSQTNSASKIDVNSTAHERYVFKPKIGSSHHWALKHLANITLGQRVLDIGPGSGFAGKELLSRGVQDLYAVEPDPSTAQELSPVYKKIAPNLEQLDQDNFDVAILMDVLEHMSEPEAYLENLLKRIKPGGQLIISVPNIAHWSVRFALLFGFFEYQERGPLDRTHLQFFSRRRFAKLVQLKNLVCAIETSYSIEPIELLLPTALSENKFFDQISQIRSKFAALLPGLMAYQFLALVKKK